VYNYYSFSVAETLKLAEKLAAKLKGGEIISLVGDLGAGKTHFVKGLACGLGIKGEITSPTFTLLHLYAGKIPLAHFDVYRLTIPEDFEELGYEDYFAGPGVVVIEWGDLISPYLPAEYLRIKIEYQAEQGRLLTFYPYGEKWEILIKELAKDVGFGD
jgi:tRNA threonylcarbamoyladenosine biosynthesis protein TsaE